MGEVLVGVKLCETLFLERTDQVGMNFMRIFSEVSFLGWNVFNGCYRIVFDTHIF